MRRAYGLLLLTSLVPWSAPRAEVEETPGAIAGEVIDGTTGLPLRGARVSATGPALALPRVAVTDAAGRFSLESLPPGRYRLEAVKDGFQVEARADLVVRSNTMLRASLAITPEVVRLEEVMVTGSHVRRLDLTTPAPVTIVSGEQLRSSGAINIGEFLQALPEQTGGMNRQLNNGGNGASQVNLRGLGAWRTLVLINGRRSVAGGTGADDSVDFNTIPAAAIQRVEILKDGASPIYGSEAIGGVVNVITRQRWTGTEATVYSGGSTRRDGGTLDAALTIGQAGDSGSLLFSIGYAEQGTAWAGDRAYSRYLWGFDMTGATSPLGLIGPYRQGSPRIPAGRVFLPQGAAGGTALYHELLGAYPGTTQFVRDPSAPLGWSPSHDPQRFVLPEDGGDGYNYQPENYLMTPNRRLSLFSTGDARLGSSTRAFYEASYVSRTSQQRLASDPFGTMDAGIVVSATNAYNPFGVDLTRVLRRLVELSNRSYTQDVAFVRVVAGLDGTVLASTGPLQGWNWSLSYNHGETQATDVKKGYLRSSRLQDALGPSFNAVTAANPVPRCGTNAAHEIAGCVPLDLFHGPGSITQQQLANLTFDGTARGTNQMSMFQASVDGPLFRLASSQPVALAVGYDYRQLAGSFEPDPVTASGDSDTDGSVRPMSATQSVQEAYLELAIPVLSGAPLAEAIEFTASARAFKYSGLAGDWTWKVGGRWTVWPGVTLRGTLSSAYRAPTLWEQGNRSAWNDNLGPGISFVLDPCSGFDYRGNPIAISPHCPAGLFPSPYADFRATASGNPNLAPERAKVFTTGLVLEPAFLRDLSITVDYWGVEVTGAPAFLDYSYYLQACYPATADPVPSSCATTIHRDPATNEITAFDRTMVNTGTEWMRGIDLALQYRRKTPIGLFGLSFLGTWLERHDFTAPPGMVFNGTRVLDGTVLKTRGTYDRVTGGQAGVFPAVRFNAGFTWALDGLSAGASVRYIGSFKQCGSPDQVDASGVKQPGGDMSYGMCSLDSTYSLRVRDHATWDALLGYSFKSSAGQTELSLGAMNVFDRAPPTIYNAGDYNSDPTAYDFMGRYLYVRVTHRL